MAHITGEGFIGNIPRVLPQGVAGAHRARQLARADLFKKFNSAQAP